MTDPASNPHWYRVARLRPRLHDQVEIHRHDYRGLIWYLLENKTTGRSHRFNPAAYQFIGMLDGRRRVQEIYDRVCAELDEFAPGQDEILDLMGRLHEADLLRSDARLDAEILADRKQAQRAKQTRQRFANPVALRFPLWDPEDFLNRHYPRVRWLFNRYVALAWLVLIAYAVLQAARHWSLIEAYIVINALDPYNLLLLFLLYPPIKFLHELGHAFCAKLEGGEVHEMGITFLLFMPVPYVNVSTATHFRDRWRRILVSAAGILVESFLAALGLLLFLAAEPGIVQSIGFNVFLIGGISSLFFNGNPLLKYDAYYMLADALGIPNLFQRSLQYWTYLAQRYLFGLRNATSPASAPGETGWFVAYSVASLAYRLAILWFIVAVVVEKYFYPGLLLAAWLVGMQLLLPAARGMRFLFTSPALQRRRGRALATSGGVVALLVAVLVLVPMPAYTINEGVVWLPDEIGLRAEHDGFVRALHAADAARVQAGVPIVELQDPFVETEARIAEARVRELRARYRASRAEDPVAAGLVAEELRVAESELRHIRAKAGTMLLSATRSGRVMLPEIDDLPGRYVRKGELLGYILNDETPTVRMAVSQDHIGQLRQRVVDIRVRFAAKPGVDFAAIILRQAPEATNRLPSAALATRGGGRFVTLPDAGDDLVTRDKIFVVDLELDLRGEPIPLGSRAWIRVDHGSETLARQWYRRVRQVFLRQFSV